MHTVQEILDVAKELPASERRRLVDRLEETLAAEAEPAQEGIDMFLALAGAGHSEHTDVSSQKGTHLAEVYADARDSK